MVFDCIAKVGLKRLSDYEVVSIQSVRPFSRIRSAVRNSAKIMNCANNLSNEQLINKNATLSVLGTIAAFSNPKAIDNVREQAQQAVIPTGKVMELFK